jgi:peptidyl-tRNA hydrolase
MDAAAYVLQNFTQGEFESLSLTLRTGVEAILTFVTEGLEIAMTRYNNAGVDADD